MVSAFNRVWDGSEAHAKCVAKIIGALAGLRPVGKNKKGGRFESRTQVI